MTVDDSQSPSEQFSFLDFGDSQHSCLVRQIEFNSIPWFRFIYTYLNIILHLVKHLLKCLTFEEMLFFLLTNFSRAVPNLLNILQLLRSRLLFTKGLQMAYCQMRINLADHLKKKKSGLFAPLFQDGGKRRKFHHIVRHRTRLLLT